MKCIFTVRLAARVGMLVLMGAATLCIPAFVQAQDSKPRQPVVAGYLPAWSATPETIAALPANALTHILYAFGTVTEEGRAALGDPCRDIGIAAQARQRRELRGAGRTQGPPPASAGPHLVGGWWTGSRQFSNFSRSR
jgi:hypothetical protein